ncbi:MAG: hypothetical protein ACJ768_03650 [Gaiellaceae bacterium]
MEKLEPFVGEWSIQGSFLGVPPGRCVFEWALGGAFLVARSEAPDPVPDSLQVFGPAAEGEGYVQHYFDSRGIARIYQMSFDERVWKLWRDTADFSPLPFRQRFEGRFADDGSRIDGRWERTGDDGAWMVDFELTFTRVGR